MPTTEKETTYQGARLGFQTPPPSHVPPLAYIRAALETISNAPNIPAPTANTARATVWVVDVGLFRVAEDSYLADGSYQTNLAEHRVALAKLIAEGEEVIEAVRRSGLMAGTEQNKFSLSDLVATLDSLHTTFECEHRPRITQKIRSTVASLFDGPKS